MLPCHSPLPEFFFCGLYSCLVAAIGTIAAPEDTAVIKVSTHNVADAVRCVDALDNGILLRRRWWTSSRGHRLAPAPDPQEGPVPYGG
ncbi:hypothetical protein F5146DRAFT_1032105 [Armillaria mellea]|nr:hypothetical protein F5146DRAFT_1032105 [Armillaria mellea]